MKAKAIVINILLFLVILLSFAIPKIWLHVKEEKILAKNYVVNSKTPVLEVNFPKADFIQKIYSRYDTNIKYQVECYDLAVSTKEILKEENGEFIPKDKLLNKINDLVKCHIVNNNFYQELVKNKMVIYRTWEYDNGTITYSHTKIFTDQDSFETAMGSVEIENTTNKMIAITLPKQYFNTSETELREYIKYLELDEITDWKLEEGEWKSEKGKIKIVRIENDETVSIKVVPISNAL